MHVLYMILTQILKDSKIDFSPCLDIKVGLTDIHLRLDYFPLQMVRVKRVPGELNNFKDNCNPFQNELFQFILQA